MYKPLPDNVTVRPSEIEGLGLFATKEIKAGTLIGRIHIPDEKEPDGYIRTPLGGFGNHSSHPNCYKLEMTDDMTVWVVSKKDIMPGEELTWHYTLYEI